MYVPYSMDDNEPDLYGGMGGYSDDEYDQTKWEGNSFGSSSRDHELDAAVHAFRRDTYVYTQEDMTKVIGHNLKVVAKYRSEIEELLGLLSYIYNRAETLPEGASQLIREQITMDRE